MSEKVIEKNRGLVVANFDFWVGLYMDKFYDGFEQKKILANKCPECGTVFVPPRKICGKCRKKIPIDQHWVELGDKGTLVNFTRTAYKISDRRARKSRSLKDIGMVQIEGSDTAIIYPLIDIEPDEIKIGMDVEIKWADEPEGGPADIEGFIKV
jgi:uncharacterized OB-fold protein